MKKKVLSLVLAAVMLSTSVDMTAFASQADDVDSAVFMEEAAEEALQIEEPEFESGGGRLETEEIELLSVTSDKEVESITADVIASEKCGENLTWTLDSDGVLTISGNGEMYDYTSDNHSPWYGYRTVITKLVVGQDVTSIGEYAFTECRTLSEVKFLGVTSIGECAFLACTGLLEVTLSKGVMSIGSNAFSGCVNLSEITLPEGVSSIGSDAFFECTTLEKVIFKGNAPSIESAAFSGVTATVYYPSDKENWTGIKGNNYDGTLKWISYAEGKDPWVDNNKSDVSKSDMFGDLTWSLENGVLTISGNGDMPDYTAVNHSPWYDDRTVITKLMISEGVTSIGSFAFSYCMNLEEVEFPKSVASIGNYAFTSCRSLNKVTLPDNITSIGEGAFSYCRSLTSVTVPEKVTIINDEAFAYCPSLTEATIPSSVNSIGREAFSGCLKLGVLIFKGNAPSITSDAFSGVTATAYYPSNKENWEGIEDNGYGGTLTWTPYAEGETPWATKQTLSSPKASAESGVLVKKGSEITLTCSVEGADIYYTLDGNDPTTDSARYTNPIEINGDTKLRAMAVLEGYENSEIVTFTYYTSKISGKCGEKLSWTLDGDGVLTISGTGEMYNYTSENHSPWYIYKDEGEDEDGITPLLYELVIEDGVTSIGEYAFYECSYLTEVTISDSVTSIGDSAFRRCVDLKEVRIPAGVESIGNYAFYGCCDNLEKVTISDSVKSIGDYAFSGCDSLEKVTISDSVTSIGNYAFSACDKLVEVRIPAGVESIGEYAFSDCGFIKLIIFAGDAPSIESDVFSGVTATAYYPSYKENWEDIKDTPYGGTLTWRSYGESEEPWKELVVAQGKCGDNLTWTLKNGVLTISGTGDMDNKCGSWYAYSAVITQLVVEIGATSIGDEAFRNCSNLEKATLPDSVKSIGEGAFTGCRSLKEITLLEGITHIGDEAFWGCDSLEKVTLPEGITYIGDGAFWSCNSLEKVTLPDGVKSIGEGAFVACRSLKEITLPEGITSISDLIFSGCSSLEKVILPEGIMSIGSDAFYDCSSLKEVIFPSSLKKISGWVFKNCTALTSIVFKGDAPTIGEEAFYDVTATIYYPSYKENWEGIKDTKYDGILKWIGYKEGETPWKVSAPTADKASGAEVEKGTTITLSSVEGAEIYYTTDGTTPSASSKKYTAPISITSDTTIKAIAVKDGYQDSEVATFTYTIKQAKEGITYSKVENIFYTGSAIKPEIQVFHGDQLLEEGTDYIVSYKNNKDVYEGDEDEKKSPQIIIKFKGAYSGTKTEVICFEIQPVDISKKENEENDAFVAGDLAVKATGKKQSPKPTLLWNGKKLKYGTDFEVAEYSSGGYTEADSYPLTITGKNGFTGERTITLTIIAKNNKNQIAMSKVSIKGLKSQPWKVEGVTPEDFTVIYKKKELAEDEYIVDYGENKNIGTGTITITGTGEDSNGDGISFIGSKTVTFKITGGKLSKAKITGVQKTYPYTGDLIKPEANLTYGNETLVEGEDYTVTYKKNRNKGTATIIFTGMNGYTGTKKKTFKITASKLGETTTVELPKANLDGEVYVVAYEKVKGGVKPDVEVTDGDTKLEKGKDYTVSYKNNKKKALFSAKKAPTIIIKGKGNYSGSVTKTFTIE